MLAGQLSSYKLWTAHEGFPSLPVAGIFGGWSAEIQWALFGLSLGLMVLNVVKPGKPAVAVLLFLEVVMCLADQNRWQPWQYQYMFMLGVYLFVQSENQRKFGWQFIMISTYFFSALWKFQPAFIYDMWLGFILKRWLHIYDIPSWAFRAGYLLPLVEMVSAFLLCFAATRKWGIAGLSLMHVLVLVMMGPFGLDVNYVLWPWNLAMPVLLILLFNRNSVIWSRLQMRPLFTLLVLVCWGLLPWLNKAGMWDRYLSSVLFSGGAPYMYVSTTNPVALKEMKPYMRNNCRMPNGRAVSTSDWAAKEMHTIPYPEYRSFKNIALAWQKRFADSSARFFIIKTGFKPVYEEIKLAGWQGQVNKPPKTPQ